MLARRYGVSEPTLYRWRDEFLEGGKAALANGRGGSADSSRRVQELERELTERDRVIGELTIANRVRVELNEGGKTAVNEGLQQFPLARLTGVLKILQIAASSWYRPAIPPANRRRPGPAGKPLDPMKTMASRIPGADRGDVPEGRPASDQSRHLPGDEDARSAA